MRKALYPMPVDGLFAHPEWVTLPCAARGMLMSICEHFWRGGCKPLPKDDDQLFAIARAHRPTWRHHKPVIVALFQDIRPELEAYWRARESKATTLDFARAKAAAQTNAKRRAQARLDAAPAPVTAPLPVTPGGAVERPGRSPKAKARTFSDRPHVRVG
jgi:uncharacterized protein YdaU (DUF1376 family)